MAQRFPELLSAAQLLARQERVAGIAKILGFVGTVEYRHVYSQTGELNMAVAVLKNTICLLSMRRRSNAMPTPTTLRLKQ